MSNPASISMFLIPGMVVKINPIIDATEDSRGLGTFIYPEEEIRYNKQTISLLRGFGLHDTSVGTLREASGSDIAVEYVHEKAARNFIYYFALTGEVGIVSIVAVPIHDHSSIVQGGPAYGTYFTDDEVSD